MHNDFRWEIERFIQRGRVAAFVLALGLAVSFGVERSLNVTVATGILAIAVIVVEIVLRRSTSQRPVVIVGWVSFALDTAVCAVFLHAIRDPIDPVVMITLMLATEAATRWGVAGAVGGGLVAGVLGVAWATVSYDAIGRDLPAASIAFRAFAPAIVSLPVGQLIARIQRQREHTRQLFAHASDPMILVADGSIVAVNPAAAALIGEPSERLNGTPFASHVGPLLDIADIERQVGVPASTRPRVCVTPPDGQPRWYDVTVETAGDDGLLFVAAHDVTDARLREQRLRFSALHDPLTGLLNRAALETQLDDWLRERRRLGLVFLDLDGFKDVNDSYGHVAGDAVLVEVAERLRHVTRDADAVHRWAGDEFCVVVPDADQAGLDGLVMRINESLSRPIEIPGGRVRVHASVGATLATTGDSNASLIHRADQQMYRVKAQRAMARRNGADG